ncbi:hypothetical protein STANM309S_02599 [Streptomyces tanashiensis]
MTVTSDVLLVFPDNLAETYIRVPLVLRVLDVQVNGTRLDVGPSCRTEKPLSSPEPTPAKYPGDHLVLLGKGQLLNGTDATGYLLTSGGPLTGEVTIPAFKDCGAGGENLDRLLTASISGPGNHIKQIQGQTCSVGVETPPPGPVHRGPPAPRGPQARTLNRPTPLSRRKASAMSLVSSRTRLATLSALTALGASPPSARRPRPPPS